jgi:hypothetical protein
LLLLAACATAQAAGLAGASGTGTREIVRAPWVRPDMTEQLLHICIHTLDTNPSSILSKLGTTLAPEGRKLHMERQAAAPRLLVLSDAGLPEAVGILRWDGATRRLDLILISLHPDITYEAAAAWLHASLWLTRLAAP